MRRQYYILDRSNLEVMQGYIDLDKVTGFNIRPQNNIEYEGIEVGHLTIASPELIKKVLIRKTKRKLNTYLNYLMSVVDDEDDDGSLEIVIDDLQRFKTLIINKYSKFLNKRYISSLLKKIRFVEKELISKLKTKIYEEERENKRRR